LINIVDTHAHLDDASFAGDLDAVMQRAAAAGIARVVVPAIDRENWEAVARLAGADRRIAAAYGLHPLLLDRHRDEHLDELPAWLDAHPHVAIGEIGLDFYVDGLEPSRQREIFARQLDMARERAVPVIVHARRAVEEVTLALRRHKGLRGVVHSFAGSAEQARQLFELGFMLGIGGPLTYERARRLREVVRTMPLQFLLLETDAPDQPLHGHQGQRNEPALTAEVLQVVAALREESAETIAAATSANAARLFGWGADRP
jgi:TatD DNase family protein